MYQILTTSLKLFFKLSFHHSNLLLVKGIVVPHGQHILPHSEGEYSTTNLSWLVKLVFHQGLDELIPELHRCGLAHSQDKLAPTLICWILP